MPVSQQWLRRLAGILLFSFAASSASAQEACDTCAPESVEADACGSPFDGPCCERPFLLGSICGFRDCLAESGITFNADNYSFYQGIVSGGINEESEYSGRNDYFVHVDGQKAGLWQGFFIDLHGETRWGDTVNFDTGALMPVNTAAIFPVSEGTETALTGVKFTQALSENFVTFAGKINVIDGFAMPFTGARVQDGFWNLAMWFPVTAARTIPYSTLGAGAAVLSNGVPVMTFMALDTNNTPTTTGFESFFDNGVTLFGNITLPTEFFGMPGRQGITGTYSTGEYRNLQPTAYFDPGVGLVISPGFDDNSWSMFYSADQALWVDPCNPKRMWGVFANIGVADNGPSPVRFTANVALYGNSPIESRPLDTFGIGYAFTDYSSPVEDFAPNLLPIDNDQVIEMFYSIGVTPWFHVSPDLQVVLPARERTLPPNAESIDTAVVLGLRAKIDF